MRKIKVIDKQSHTQEIYMVRHYRVRPQTKRKKPFSFDRFMDTMIQVFMANTSHAKISKLPLKYSLWLTLMDPTD